MPSAYYQLKFTLKLDMYSLKEILTIMENNQSLAGWAQAIGALIGIALAILIPAYQRYTQILDAKRQRSEIRLNHDLGVFYLLGDIKSWLESQNNGSDYPRSLNLAELTRDELLKRILMFEGSAIEHESVAALFRARGAILNTNLALVHKGLEDAPLSKTETTLLIERIVMVRDYESEASLKMNKSFDELYRLRLFLTARLMYPLIKKIFGTLIVKRVGRKEMAKKISKDLAAAK